MSDWQPIETAPKDGSYVVAMDDHDYVIVVRWHRDGYWYDTNGDEIIVWNDLVEWDVEASKPDPDRVSHFVWRSLEPKAKRL